MNINYVKVKRKEVDICNICCENRKLSWDHVPPKGSIFFHDVELKSLFNKYVDTCPKEFSQNGTKFRTLCSECNNLLGTKYDVEFNGFVQDIAIEVYNSFPNVDRVNSYRNPAKIVRALFGHLLAAKGKFQESEPDKLMKKFIFNDELTDPELNIYYWFYPYPRIEIMRDYARADITRSNYFDLFSLLKMYPVSFYVTDKEVYPQLGNLRNLCMESKNETIRIELDISMDRIQNHDWPHFVEGNNILLGDSENSPIISSPRVKKK